MEINLLLGNTIVTEVHQYFTQRMQTSILKTFIVFFSESSRFFKILSYKHNDPKTKGINLIANV